VREEFEEQAGLIYTMIVAKIISLDLWRNGSALDSRSSGCQFKSDRVHVFALFFILLSYFPNHCQFWESLSSLGILFSSSQNLDLLDGERVTT